MARLSRAGFLTLAIVFHLIYTYSIFDIYFVSPIVSGMRAFGVEREPRATAPAKRLVLFVGDGLRADKAFQSFPDPSPPNDDISEPDLTPRPLAPFIRSQVLNHGTFGVSHTRVPTESRPGHVALIAGLYEDVSAVATGWKLNPVNFDSVFNRSRHTWSWGSPDILPMFKEGAVPGRIDAETYSAEAEDFTLDAVHLDEWVFDNVKELFAAAKQDRELDARLREDKIVLFLHLLGLDTTGHAFRPYSKEYLHNIKVVDQGVREITDLIENFYGDDETAFVFTADHGMSDWGSHGDGHPDNTRTPLVAWGSGIAKPAIVKDGVAPGHEDGFSSDWNLDHVTRHDVAQADVAALMAYLVGLDFPVNSVGELPLAYVDADPKEKAQAALANAQGVLEMYRVKEEQKQASSLRYKPYGPFTEPHRSPESQITAIRRLISMDKFDQATTRSSALLHEGLEGLRYLQTYDWLFLRSIVTMGYLGWIAYAIAKVVDSHVLQGTHTAMRTTESTIFFSSLLVVLYAVLWIQRSSWRYYAYGFFPVFFWEEVFSQRKALEAGRRVLFSHVKSLEGYALLAIQGCVYIGVLEALVQSYFNREIYTVCFVLAGFWPLLYGSAFLLANRLLVAVWAVGCGLLSIFTLLPVVKVDDADLITIGGTLMFLAGVFYMRFERGIVAPSKTTSSPTKAINNASRNIMGIQLGMIALAVYVTRSSISSLQERKGIPLGNQVVGWLVLVASLVLPFVHKLYPNDDYLHRLVVIFLAFSPTFIILTISYEGLFYFVFSVTLLAWVELEHKIYTHVFSPNQLKSIKTTQTTHRALTISDARIALFFFFLIQAAFFSTGNIASVSSFSLDSVYRLIPIFSPFSQGALLILKLLIPFAVISANLGILNHRLGVAPSALFMVVIAICDVMTLNFFYMVRDEGSWLDIGTTISHFCIASLLCVFVAGLEFLSESFISGVDFGSKTTALEDANNGGADDKVVENLASNVLNGGNSRTNGASTGKRAATQSSAVSAKAAPNGSAPVASTSPSSTRDKSQTIAN